MSTHSIYYGECGVRLPEGAAFCGECGAPVARPCARRSKIDAGSDAETRSSQITVKALLGTIPLWGQLIGILLVIVVPLIAGWVGWVILVLLAVLSISFLVGKKNTADSD